MAEYIEREDLLSKLHIHCKINCMHYPREQDIYCDMCELGDVIKLIKGCPTADVKPVIWRGCRGMDGIKYYDHNWNEIETPDESQEIEYVPVVHGHWIVDEDGNIKCSECGHHGVGDNYCERCGAKMDEVEDATD